MIDSCIKSALVLASVFFITGVSYAQAVEDYSNKGIEYASQGKFKEAAQELKKALEINKSDIYIKEYLKLINSALKKNIKKETVVYLFKGLDYVNKNMLDAAITELNKAVSANCNCAIAHFNLAAVYVKKGMIEKAIVEYKKTVKINPGYSNAHGSLGVIYINKGMFDEAIAELNKAIKTDPGYANAYYNLSVAYYNKKQYNLSIKNCDKAIGLGYKVNPDFLKKLEAYRYGG